MADSAFKQSLRDTKLKTPRNFFRTPVRSIRSALKGASTDGSPEESNETSPRAPSNRSGDDMFSIMEDFIEGEADDDSVRVFIRVRPPNAQELDEGPQKSCLRVMGVSKIALNTIQRQDKTYDFTFDYVLGESASQEDVYEVAGLPMVDNCLNGYNSSIFAYGQTGAGKTFTMMGCITANGDATQRGLAPRVFEYLFSRISQEEDAKGRDNLRFSLKCSYLEIYNETITDLLNPTSTNLQIREDLKRGCYVEGLSEENALNEDEVMSILRKGSDNRHVGETRLNRESSRSHSVFTCTLERNIKSSNGLTNVIFSRLNLIDLAGSERVQSGAHGGSQAQGQHFNEACHINKSLTSLGRVIMELVEAQRSGKNRHIPYRDSRLTFLLQDSLGGNAKTMIVANVSPSLVSSAETLSTLQFVQRAKTIRNKAQINMDYRGEVPVLRAEIFRLNKENEALRSGKLEPLIQETTELRNKLEEGDKQKQQFEMRIDALTAENSRLRREKLRMEHRLLEVETTCLGANAEKLESVVQQVESAQAACINANKEQQAIAKDFIKMAQQQQAIISSMEEHAKAQSARIMKLEKDSEHQATLRGAAEAYSATLKAESLNSQQALIDSRGTAQQLTQELQVQKSLLAAAAQEISRLQEQLSQSQVKLAEEQGRCEGLETEVGQRKAQLAAAAEKLAASQARTNEMQGKLEHETSQRFVVEQQLTEKESSLATAGEQQKALVESHQQVLQQLQDELQQAAALAERLKSELLEGQSACATLAADLEQKEKELQRVTLQLDLDRTGLQDQLSAMQQSYSEEKQRALDAQEAAEQLRLQLHETQVASEVLRSDLQSVTLTLEEKVAELSMLKEESGVLQAELSSKNLLCKQQADTVVGLEDRLDAALKQSEAERDALTSTQAELASTRNDLQGVYADLEGERQEHTKTSTALSESRISLAQLEETVKQHVAEVASLTSHLCEVQEQLSSECRSRDNAQKEAVNLNGQLAEAAETHRSEVLELKTALAGAKQELEDKQESLEKLQQAIQESATAHSLSSAEWEELHASLLSSRTQLLEQVECQSKEVMQLQADTRGLASEKGALEADRARLKESLSACQSSLEATVSEKNSLRAEVELLKARCHEVEAAGTAEVSKLQAEIGHLKKQASDAALAAASQIRDQESQLRHLRKDLITGQQTYEVRKHELKTEIKSLQKALDASRDEAAQTQAKLELRSQDVTTLKQAFSQEQQKNQQLSKSMADLEKESSDTIKTLEDQLAAMTAECTQLKSMTDDMDQSVKSHLMTNAKQSRAFNEIKRLIEWATSPPGSVRNSIAGPRDSILQSINFAAAQGGFGKYASMTFDMSPLQSPKGLFPSRNGAVFSFPEGGVRHTSEGGSDLTDLDQELSFKFAASPIPN